MICIHNLTYAILHGGLPETKMVLGKCSYLFTVKVLKIRLHG